MRRTAAALIGFVVVVGAIVPLDPPAGAVGEFPVTPPSWTRETTVSWTCSIGDEVVQSEGTTRSTAPPQVHPGTPMFLAVHAVDLPALADPAEWGEIELAVRVGTRNFVGTTPAQSTAPGSAPVLTPWSVAILAPTDVTSTAVRIEAITASVVPDGGQSRAVRCVPDVIGGVDASIRITDTFVTCMGQLVTVFGTEGADTLADTGGPDVVATFGGTDLLVDRGGSDVICLGDDRDRIWYTEADAPLFVALGAARPGAIGTTQWDLYEGVEGIVGTPYDDIVIGDDQRNELSGGGGNDYVAGLGDDDRLFGDIGNDILVGGSGTDILDDRVDQGGEVNVLDCGSSELDEFRGGPFAVSCERDYVPQPPPWP